MTPDTVTSPLDTPLPPREGRPRPPARTLHELLRQQAEVSGDAVAIVAPGGAPLSYRRLLGRIETTVATLRVRGLGRNDRVAVVLPNGPEMAATFLGVAAGATCAPLNPAYRLGEFEFYLSDLRAKALVIASDADSPARHAAERQGIQIIDPEALGRGSAEGFGPSVPALPRAALPAFAAPEDIALVLHTSGTTARPKIVPLTQENLCSSAHAISSTLRLTGADRCLNVMPLFHIHGLVGALVASLAAGASVVATPGMDPEAFFRWLDELGPTWYTAVPTMHQAILGRAHAHGEIIRRRPLRFVRSCSAALPSRVLTGLEETFGVQVIEAYGMTEASHQIATNPLSPRARKPGSVGLATGAEIAVVTESGDVLPAGEIGEIVVRGPGVIRGYENNPTANTVSFRNGWLRTGDQGLLDGEGYLFLIGRLKDIVNRGGEKISPAEIDDVLMRHPAVREAVAFAVPHPTLGEDVAAAIVLNEGGTVTEREIRGFAAAHLSDFKVPSQLLFVDAIPKGPTGKLQRRDLAGSLADRLAGKRSDGFAEPTTPTEARLAEIWKSVLGSGRIGIRDSFYALGGDSLGLAVMTAAVEASFHTTIPLDELLASPTIERLAALVEATTTPSAPRPSAPAAPARAPRSSGLRDSAWGGLKNRLLQLLALYAPGYTTTRVWLHRRRGVTIGDNVSIGLSTLIETAYPRLVSVGNNVTIGMRCVIIAHLRDSTVEARALGEPTVRIEDNVYVGPGVIILPHVTIGEGAVIAAGSVVSRSIPARTLARGNPARPIAHCGVSLGGGVSYEAFLRHLTPIKDAERS